MDKLGLIEKIKKISDLLLDRDKTDLKTAEKLYKELKQEDINKLSREEFGEFAFIGGQLAYFMDYPDEAIRALRKALKFIDRAKRAKTFYYIAGAYFDKDEFNEAIKFIRKALSCNKRTKDKILELKLMSTLYLSYLNLKKYRESLNVSKKIINFCKNNPKLLKDELFYGAISNLATCYWKLGDEKKADEYASKVISMKNVPNAVVKSTYNILGHRCLEKNRHKEAQQYYKKALSYVEEETDKKYYRELIAECDKGLNYIKGLVGDGGWGRGRVGDGVGPC